MNVDEIRQTLLGSAHSNYFVMGAASRLQRSKIGRPPAAKSSQPSQSGLLAQPAGRMTGKGRKV
jgi:hypothetical protein